MAYSVDADLMQRLTSRLLFSSPTKNSEEHAVLICEDLFCTLFFLVQFLHCFRNPSHAFVHLPRLVDAKGVTYICEACPAGTSQSSGASLQCDACGFGEFQNECLGCGW